MSRDAVKAEAEKLIEQFGPVANAKARELMRAAMRRRDHRRSAFFGAVVAKSSGELILRESRMVCIKGYGPPKSS